MCTKNSYDPKSRVISILTRTTCHISEEYVFENKSEHADLDINVDVHIQSRDVLIVSVAVADHEGTLLLRGETMVRG